MDFIIPIIMTIVMIGFIIFVLLVCVFGNGATRSRNGRRHHRRSRGVIRIRVRR